MDLLIHEFDSFNDNRIFILREDLLPMLFFLLILGVCHLQLMHFPHCCLKSL